MSLMSSLALVTIRSSIASPRVRVSITWVKKLSSMHSRSLPDCLQLSMLLFQQMLGIIESFRLEKTFKIKSNRKPDTAKSTTKSCPLVPRLHTF
ncbi:hypothetical protein QYF61_008948 [Mycteria americana]|uniref:Uncharacterized protein n=1 Tax=Mycteria americana TaxID=33587 RepID=A0AAN7S2W2_MYCAM|nr:hypothetical protein QYF61_008948 [Mycteria americana]